MDQERKQQLDALYEQYARGGGASLLLLRLRYYRKVALWNTVIGGSKALKRFLDICGGLGGLLLFSPIFAATALAIKLEDKGKVFFSQKRVGRDGTLFDMYKFRSMVPNADKLKDQLADQDESQGVTFKVRKDPRITRVGAVIRKLSIDEFPQFYNVLIGDMSLVGPRPAVPREVQEYTLAERERLRCKPGITCLWQIGGRSDLSFEEQVALDVEYIESRSFFKDLIILLKTVPAVLLGKGAY